MLTAAEDPAWNTCSLCRILECLLHQHSKVGGRRTRNRSGGRDGGTQRRSPSWLHQEVQQHQDEREYREEDREGEDDQQAQPQQHATAGACRLSPDASSKERAGQPPSASA